jgi:hypothetical protein
MALLPGTYEADPTNTQSEFTPITPGEYPFTIIEADYVQNKKQNGYFVYIKARIDDNAANDQGGRTFEDRFNIDNANEKAVEISTRQFNSLLVATGKLSIGDTDELIGLAAVAQIKVEPAKPYMKDGEQKPGSPSNSVGVYKSAGAAAAPAPTPTASTGGGSAPWKKQAA